ncbi:hypothetical protein P7C73_g3543, partial [Tremellales sp. Uapishka_1]
MREPSMEIQRQNTFGPPQGLGCAQHEDEDALALPPTLRPLPEGLPTYEQSLGPPVVGNAQSERAEEIRDADARFGRWRGWIEKRAHERHDESTEGRVARRAAPRQLPLALQRPPSYHSPVRHEYGAHPEVAVHPGETDRNTPLLPTSLRRTDYGSSSNSHSQHRITCALPILNGSLVIFGTTGGLGVLITVEGEDRGRCVWSNLPVWDLRILRSEQAGDSKTPRGSILVLCGGREDSSRPGKPSGKDVEVRVWKLESLVSLVRWSSVQRSPWTGLDMSRKGKAKVSARGIFGRSAPQSSTGRSASEADTETLTTAWAQDHIVLPKVSSDVVALSSWTDTATTLIAVGTINCILLFEKEQVSYRLAKTFYLPSPPLEVSFLELDTAMTAETQIVDRCSGTTTRNDEDDSIFGLERYIARGADTPTVSTNPLPDAIFVSFGTKACVIRIKDSVVMDMTAPTGGSDRKGVWGNVVELQFHSGEGAQKGYLFTRGHQSFLYPAPMNPAGLPIHLLIPSGQNRPSPSARYRIQVLTV